ncbi:MAG TPA: lytic transglycosylase domain-containing protein, partial [Steroidobacteraceae bacterium]|nr:lytic transglycosylase domain-containing protein [Steroidobacteraceae bacterium]
MRSGALTLVWLFAFAFAALGAGDALSASRHKDIRVHRSKVAAAAAHKRDMAPDAKRHKASSQSEESYDAVVRVPLPIERPAAASLPPYFSAAKQAIALIRKSKWKDVAALAASISDPVAQKLIEWVLLRSSDSPAGFERYVAFLSANPDWPGALLRRSAEARLWQERRDGTTVRRFVGKEPVSSVGRLTLARVLMNEGDRDGAAREVRAAWQSAELSAEMESAVLDTFTDTLSRADHVARMDRRLGAKDFGAAMRSAKRVGDDQVAIVKACIAAEAKSAKGEALLDAVSTETRMDLGYTLCRLHWLMRNDAPGSNLHGRIVTPKENIAAVVRLVLAASPEDLQRQDTDEWWRERRALARKLIDLSDAATAYQVVRQSAPPANPYYRAEFHFMAGWIALRFLADPAIALGHFTHIDDGATDPVLLARAAYWRGRAAEAAGERREMRAQYEVAARYPTAYYGQLARARLGIDEIALRPPPQSVNVDASEALHTADILYAIGEHDLVLHFVADLAEESSDPAILAGLGELTARYHDARAMLMVGKTAVARGFPLDQYAFPNIGVPSYSPIGPEVDRCVVYSIARTESGFDQHDRSSADAVGLMQVTPEAGRDTAKRVGVAYDWDRLVSDPVYNTQMGAAEIAALLKEYRGSYIMT